ncbi:hypothetical protein ACFPM0_20545 [Pseudonocardia sulfidoxydans]|uniref:hypothetical protein n=1 Tax=Pseudonocardia sulfidoxydans TaxID=54011 RepID=UPI00360CF4EB
MMPTNRTTRIRHAHRGPWDQADGPRPQQLGRERTMTIQVARALPSLAARAECGDDQAGQGPQHDAPRPVGDAARPQRALVRPGRQSASGARTQAAT